MDRGSGDWEWPNEVFLLGIVIVIKISGMKCTELLANTIYEQKDASCAFRLERVVERESQKSAIRDLSLWTHYRCSFMIHFRSIHSFHASLQYVGQLATCIS